ncbi:signal peptidase II [Bifidobacterium reuteri]|uniref:Lipoprotein signal peptidase n=1 Tax=Bifidobacterium reuteri TaxID=983706 RepID=A0A5J5E425_9BIFI|nr:MULTISPECIES: signal peptidase II [Bifidobacterium]KAA8823848.1 signal peptidase II [Bifidobacterium reuteri]TPF77390.1 lipoprotein signal peptidase [Bifidobacterium sp. UTCIF-1]TPF79427.1 lipoprotein signal peptidase [Bifidobacterium sp. UTCIF-24]TPF81408.1 lipoprotein signal peptidase [Bifidobacterium sp. UTCIF-3]TPF83486.1 lipoprotein signal peptidase [Bifidobacterium sp. UTCIF-36]
MTNQQGRLRMRVAVFACVSAVALIVDQLTKAWALAALSSGQTIRVIPGLLSLTLVRNPGASLGMGSNATWIISLLAIVASCALLYFGVRSVSLKWTVSLSLAFAGAFGNLIDRVMYADGFLNGKVVDFLNYGWSVGNVADIYLVAAGVAIVVLILFNEPFSTADADEAHANNAESDGTKVDAE